MTAISYHDTVNDLQDGLYWDDGPFARHDWFALLEKSGHKPFVAVVRDGTDIACMPLERGADGLQCLTNWYAFTWSPGTSSTASETSLRALASDLAQNHKRIDFTKVPDDYKHASELEEAFRQTGWQVLREAADINHILRPAGRSFDEYLATRPGKLRTTLKRKTKKLDVKIVTSFDAVDWAAYEDIYADSWKPEEGDPQFLRAFAQQESEAGRYLFGIASAQGRPVAAQLWTLDLGTAYIHKLAHRKDATALSPGSVLTAALFQHAIDIAKVELIDFGTGNDGYKADWMETTRPRYNITCLRRNAPRNWPLLAKSVIRKLVSRPHAS